MSDTGQTTAIKPAPVVKPATMADIVAAFEAGLRDFRAAPLFGLVFGGLYMLGGMATVWFTTHAGWSWLPLPMTAGFALIGPFVAIGLYEVSRRRERGEPLAWAPVFGCILAQGRRELVWMSLVSVFAFLIWMYQVRLLLALFFGLAPIEGAAFVNALFHSREGLTFLAIGTVWGAVLSVVVFSLTVVSFPLLLDRDRDFITAMITSVKAVVASPRVMVGWGLVTAALIFLSALPFFLGFLITLPVLGHATWHLYRRIVAAD
jgi:uncharacterized membrane protein